MKKVIKISVLLIAFCGLLYAHADAQSRNSKKENAFTSRLWYGGGLNLGFSGSQFESIFQLGVSPMVGYKIFEEFSIGPRVGIQYSHYRSNLGGRTETANPLSWAAGVFSRYKIMRTIFAHAEYEFENAALFSYGVDGLEVLRRERSNFYVGAGYNSGSTFGYEIVLLYNTLQPQNEIESPFRLRVGFTYNF